MQSVEYDENNVMKDYCFRDECDFFSLSAEKVRIFNGSDDKLLDESLRCLSQKIIIDNMEENDEIYISKCRQKRLISF